MSYVIKFKLKPSKKGLKALGGYEMLKAKTLASAIEKAVTLSKKAPNTRYEIYYQDVKKQESSLMMVIKNGDTIESRG